MSTHDEIITSNDQITRGRLGLLNVINGGNVANNIWQQLFGGNPPGPGAAGANNGPNGTVYNQGQGVSYGNGVNHFAALPPQQPNQPANQGAANQGLQPGVIAQWLALAALTLLLIILAVKYWPKDSAVVAPPPPAPVAVAPAPVPAPAPVYIPAPVVVAPAPVVDPMDVREGQPPVVGEITYNGTAVSGATISQAQMDAALGAGTGVFIPNNLGNARAGFVLKMGEDQFVVYRVLPGGGKQFGGVRSQEQLAAEAASIRASF